MPTTNTQPQSVLNPTAFDGDFSTITWRPRGSVSVSAHSATLAEAATAQSSLQQSFIVNADDRFLRFTLSALDLHQASSTATGINAGPPDAFEVTLLNATTGLPIAAPIGLSHSDALLNLQPGTTEYRSPELLRIDNLDGSRTYTLDLRSIEAGTPITLSFALIGFGAADSHVSIRDVSLVNLPETQDDSVLTAEDTAVRIDALANDGDAGPGRGFLPEVASAPAHGQVTVNADGTFAYAPDQDFFGMDSFTYRLSDGAGKFTIATVSITVSPVSDAPVAHADTSAAQEDDGRVTIAAGELLANDTDADPGDTKTIVGVSTSAAGAKVSLVDGNVVYDFGDLFEGLAEGAGATDTFTYTIADSAGLTSTATVTMVIAGRNDAPVTANDEAEVQEDGTLLASGNALANDKDVDAATTLTVAEPGSYAGVYGTLDIAADGSYTYTLANDSQAVQALRAGEVVTDVFAYAASDGVASTPGQVRVSITGQNDAPVARPDTAAVLEDGGAVTLAGGTLLGNDTDVDAGDSKTITAVTNSSAGAQVGLVNGNVVYDIGNLFQSLGAGVTATDSFTYTMVDSKGAASTTSVTMTITGVNDAPVAVSSTVTGVEDTPYVFAWSDFQASDVDSDGLTLSITALPVAGQLQRFGEAWTAVTVGQPLASSEIEAGHLRLVPDANFFGSDSFSYKLNDGTLDSNVAQISITVTPVNDAPIAIDSQVTTPEDTATQINLPALASDVDSPALSAAVVAAPAHGTLLQNADGTVTYKPQANYFGTDSFTFKVNDGQLDSNEATVNLTVTAVNDAPLPSPLFATLSEDGSAVLRLLDASSDVDHDPLAVSVTAAQHGTLQKNADGSYTYTPNPDYSGEDTFSYRVNDGTLDSELATVQLTIEPVADAPTLSLGGGTDGDGATRELFRTGWESVGNHSPTVTLVHQHELEGWTLIRPPAGPSSDDHQGDDDDLGGDDDDDIDHNFEIWSDGDQMHNLQGRPQIVHAAPGGGKNWLELNNSKGEGHQTIGIGRAVTTVAGATYTLSFDYAGHIGYGLDTTAIGIYVDDVKLASYANTSPAISLDWHALQYQFSGNGKARTIRIITEATQIDANGRGAMLDNIALSETAPINSGFKDSLIRLSSITAALRDKDGSEALSVAITGLPAGAKLSDDSHTFTAVAGSDRADVTAWNLTRLSLLPPSGFAGTINLGVEATATELSNGASAVTAAPLAVTVLNSAPVARNAAVDVAKNASATIDLRKLASDAENDALVFSVTQPGHGALVKDAEGVYTYTPVTKYTGQDSFTYTASDGRTNSTGRVKLVVK